MSFFRLQVANIRCNGCVSIIQKTLQDIRGVNAVSVNPTKCQVIVEHDGTTEEEVVSRTLDRMGYPKVLDNSLLKQIKSYISCVIGRVK